MPAARAYRVPARYREDMDRLAQYIIRYPFSVDKMQPNSSGRLIIYRSGMKLKIQRSFEVFNPCNFIARINRRTRYLDVQGTPRTLRRRGMCSQNQPYSFQCWKQLLPTSNPAAERFGGRKSNFLSATRSKQAAKRCFSKSACSWPSLCLSTQQPWHEAAQIAVP